jgi:hypothetical protein
MDKALRRYAALLLGGVILFGCSGSREINGPVTTPVASVVVTPTSATLVSLGGVALLEATAYDAAGERISGKTFTWESSDEGIATVSPLGMATAVANGTATIMATVDGVSGSASITVDQMPAHVTVRPAGVSLTGVGATQGFAAEVQDAQFHTMLSLPMTWSSLNPRIATIDASGVATTVATGQVTIAATVPDGPTGYALVTVSVPGAAAVSAWTSTVIDPAEALYGVWGMASNDVFAVGRAGTIQHFDGTTWTAMASGIDDDLRDVWGSSGENVFAVGQSGKILQYDGAAWSTIAEVTTAPLEGVWGASPHEIYAVGARGTIVHYDATGWRVRIYGTGPFFHHVWGTSPRDVFAVGDEGLIVHYDGIVWTEMTSGTTDELRSVWGTSSTNVYAVGNSGTILRYDGTAWSTEANSSAEDLWAVWGSSPTDVYVAGVESAGSITTILHYDGTTWSVLTSDAGPSFYGLWGNSGGLYAVGEGGVVRHGSH